MFAKLNIECPKIEINENIFGKSFETKDSQNMSFKNLDDESKILLKKAIENGVGGIKYSELTLYKNIFESLVPKCLYNDNTDAFVLQVIRAKSYVTPHRDDTRKTAINFYLKTNNERTVFYKNPKKEIFADGNYLYDLSWVEECDSFIAKDFDVYVLNVNKIHSVLNCKGEDNLRISVSFGTTLPYEEVYTILKNNNLIWREND